MNSTGLAGFAKAIRDVRAYLYGLRPGYSAPGPQSLVMNSEWAELTEAAFSNDGVHHGSPYSLGDRVLGYPVILDETYEKPLFRNTAEYLAEREARDGE